MSGRANSKGWIGCNQDTDSTSRQGVFGRCKNSSWKDFSFRRWRRGSRRDKFNSPLERTLVNVGKEVGFKTVEHNPLGACGQPDLESTTLDIGSISIPEGAYVVLVTRGVNDAELLEHISKFPNLNYVGLVASENRWTAAKKELEQRGVGRSFIESVHSPAGVRIHSVLLQEIAISILAELIEVRRNAESFRGTRKITRVISSRSL